MAKPKPFFRKFLVSLIVNIVNFFFLIIGWFSFPALPWPVNLLILISTVLSLAGMLSLFLKEFRSFALFTSLGLLIWLYCIIYLQFFPGAPI